MSVRRVHIFQFNRRGWALTSGSMRSYMISHHKISYVIVVREFVYSFD